MKDNKGAGIGFDLLSRNTDVYGEKGVYMQALNKYVLPSITSKNKFLDIGSGPGNLTMILSKLFDETVIVEPDRKFFNIVTNSISCEGFNKKWEEADIGEDKFDLILAIHIFYYIDKKDWVLQVKRMINALNKNGKVVIVLESKKSHLYTFPNQFLKNESHINSEELMRMLLENNIKFTSHLLTFNIWANGEKEAGILGNFMLDAHSVLKNDTRALALWNHKGNKFYVTCKDGLMIIEK